MSYLFDRHALPSAVFQRTKKPGGREQNSATTGTPGWTPKPIEGLSHSPQLRVETPVNSEDVCSPVGERVRYSLCLSLPLSIYIYMSIVCVLVFFEVKHVLLMFQ